MVLRCVVSLALGLFVVSSGAVAQDKYPSKPVRIIVSFAAGGPTDIVARIIGAKLSEYLGQQFVVENRAGAGGNLGADAVAKSPGDGYTLLMGTVSTHAINPGLYKKMPYDPVKDFEPVTQVGVTPSIFMVHPSLGVKNVKDLVAMIKSSPGKYSYASSGMGSILHLCGEQFKTMAGGLDLQHVPYRGSGVMMNDLVSGQVPMAFDGTPTALPQVQSGAMVAVGAGMKARARALPDLPTMDEQGFKGFECYTWNAIFAPAKTPAAVVNLLAQNINKALEDQTVFKRLQDAGIDPTPGSSPEKLATFVKVELDKWAPIIKASGTQMD
jgi:tripartite-type tricarboxylate transporter receptor subunit TctC